MSYGQFLLLFLVVPLAVLFMLLRRKLLDRRYLTLVGVLTGVALLYMAPWDHTAAEWGLWTWSAGHTWGARWWSVPPEEFLFCILEAILGVTVTYAVLIWRGRIDPQPGSARTAKTTPPREEAQP